MKKPARKAVKATAKKPAAKAAKRAGKAPARRAVAAKKPAGKRAAATKAAPARKPAPKKAARPAVVRPAAKPARPAPARPAGPEPIPEGFRTVTPYLSIDGAAKAIEYYEAGFGAVEIMRLEAPGGLLGHAEIKIGDSIVMLADPWPGQYTKAPTTLGGATASIMLYVPDVDGFMAQAVKAGASVTQPPTNMFWGDRFGKLRDPFGHEWGVSTHVEDVAPEEMGRRMEEAMKSMASAGGAEPPEAA